MKDKDTFDTRVKEGTKRRIFKTINAFILKKYFLPTTRHEMLAVAMDFVNGNNVKGDYLEFGVFAGKIFSLAYFLAKRRKMKSMNFYAFDSFEGIPKLNGIDTEVGMFNEGDFACDLNTFKKNMVKQKVNLDRVYITPGWFKDTLNDKTKKELPVKKAAIIWIDSDIYEAAVPVLDFILDYLQDGTIIIFDDWFCYRANPEM